MAMTTGNFVHPYNSPDANMEYAAFGCCVKRRVRESYIVKWVVTDNRQSSLKWPCYVVVSCFAWRAVMITMDLMVARVTGTLVAAVDSHMTS
ncbi:hypothetical protein N7466_000310 [Penicillium verhagenii]|uniref:uncharacterized protein n=1 Tax=Penicillium verhagenii TaxID=1562060 RepID=UPI00254516B7|nr:uncharacterized protein N7466_000310 [Penicillium verhagenii]KAJ5947295.1 hypothetical protein N7466_000310 [Penicillium verhagenii]